VLGCAGFIPVNRWQRGLITGTEGVDYVTCRFAVTDGAAIFPPQLLHSRHDPPKLVSRCSEILSSVYETETIIIRPIPWAFLVEIRGRQETQESAASRLLAHARDTARVLTRAAETPAVQTTSVSC
jgi:hypothetical protein